MTGNGIELPNTMTLSLDGKPNGNGSKPAERGRINSELFGESEYLLPHSRTFSGIINTVSRVYSFRFDEAMRHAPANAIAMRHDAYFAALIQERITPLSRWEWQIEIDADDKKEAGDKGEEIRQSLESIVRATWAFDHMREYLGEFVWPGRYGAQVVWGEATIGGKRRKVIKHHRPVDGDKILTDFDGCPSVAVYPSQLDKYNSDSVREVRLPAGANKLKTTDKRGAVVYTDRFPVLKLDRPDYRQRFIIPIFKMRDGDYYDPYSAGMVGGIGLRHYAYWAWWLRDEMLAWATDFMEKVGSLGIMLFFYEESNTAQKANAITAAKSVGNGNALACPVARGDSRAGGVELLPANLGGVQFLTQFIGDYFEGHIERLIVGQKMSADHTGSGGLGGSGAANFAMDTKYQLLASDAVLMSWAFTQDLVKPALEFNFPGCPWKYHFKLVVPSPDSDKKLENVSKAFSMGVDFAEDDVRELTGVPKPADDAKTLRQIQQEQQQQQMQSDVINHPTSMKYAPELVGAMLKTGNDPAATAKLSELASNPEQIESVVGESGGNQSPPNTDGITENGGATAHYAWVPGTSRGGKVKAVGTAEHEGRTLYGEDAERALRGKPTKAGPETPTAGKPAKSADESATKKADKHSSASTALGILDNPHLATAEDVGALADHLKNASAKDIRQLSERYFREKKGLKADVISKLVAYAKGQRANAGIDDSATPEAAPTTPDIAGGTPEAGGKAGIADASSPDESVATAAKPSPTVPQSDANHDGKPDKHAVHEHFRSALAASDHLSEGQRAHYGRSIDRALSAMPAAAHDLIAQHVKDVSFHKNTDDVGHGVIEALQAAPDATLEGSKRLSAFARALNAGKVKPGAAWVPKHGGIHLDGDLGEHYQAHEVYAHSLGHAIDGPDKKISKSRDWQAAWEEEIAPGGLSKYAGKSAHEGFAEFCRLVYGADNDPKSMEAIFPKASAAMQARGLWPESTAGEDTDVEEPTPVDVHEQPSEQSEQPREQADDSLRHDESTLRHDEGTDTESVAAKDIAEPSQPSVMTEIGKGSKERKRKEKVGKKESVQPTGGNILPEVFAERVPLDDTQDGAHVDAVPTEPLTEPEAKPTSQANPDHLAALAAIPAGKTGMVNGHEVLHGGDGIYSMTRDGRRFVGVDHEIAAAVAAGGQATEAAPGEVAHGFEKVPLDEALALHKKNADMRLPRPGETEDDLDSYKWNDAKERAIKRHHKGTGYYRADIPLEWLKENDGEVDPKRMERLDSIGGTDDPIHVGLDRFNDPKNKGLSFNVDDGNNRVRHAKLAGKKTIPAWVSPYDEEALPDLRKMLDSHGKGDSTATNAVATDEPAAEPEQPKDHATVKHEKAIRALNNKIAAWKRKHSLANVVVKEGGIDPTSIKGDGGIRELQQRGIHPRVFRGSKTALGGMKQSGLGSDVMAEMLHNHGHIRTPDHLNHDDHLLDQLAGGAVSLNAPLDELAELEHEIYQRELAHALSTASPEDVAAAVRSGSEQGAHVAQTAPEAHHAREDDDVGQVEEPQGDEDEVAESAEPVDEADDSFDFGLASPEHAEVAEKLNDYFPNSVEDGEPGLPGSGEAEVSDSPSVRTPHGSDGDVSDDSGMGDVERGSGETSDTRTAEQSGTDGEHEARGDVSANDAADADLAPGRQKDLFGAPVFRSKRGTQLSLDELTREVWPDKAKEWAEAQGKTVDQITAGGRFRVGDKWYTIGNAETGYKVDEADAPKVTGQDADLVEVSPATAGKPGEAIPAEPVGVHPGGIVPPSDHAMNHVQKVLKQAEKAGQPGFGRKGQSPQDYAEERLRELSVSLSLSRGFRQSNEEFEATPDGQLSKYYSDVAKAIKSGDVKVGGTGESKQPHEMTRAEWNAHHFDENVHRGLPADYFSDHSFKAKKSDTSHIETLPSGVEIRMGQHGIAHAFDGEKNIGTGDGKAFVVHPEYQKQGIGKTLLKATYTGNPIGSRTAAGQQLVDSFHKSAVADAIAAGKSVPAEVLNDYPDLQAEESKPGDAAPTTSEPTAPEEGVGDFASAKKWGIYPVKVKGETKYAVRENMDNPRGMGDTLHDSPADAKSHAAAASKREEERNATREANKNKKDAEDAATAAEKQKREDLKGYGADLSPHQKALVVKTLNQPAGNGETRKEKLERLVKGGLEIRHESGEDRFYAKDGRIPRSDGTFEENVEYFLDGWTKAEEGYARHLIGKRDANTPYDHPAAIASAVASAPSGHPALDEMRKAYAIHHTEMNRYLGKERAEAEARGVAKITDPKQLLEVMEKERAMQENRDFLHDPHYKPLIKHIDALKSLTGAKLDAEPVKPTGEHTKVKPGQENHTSFGTDHATWHTQKVPDGKHRVTIRGSKDPSKPSYIARLTGTDPRYHFQREFLRTPTLGPDDHHYLDLGDGVYEAHTSDHTGEMSQKLFKVEKGKIRHLNLTNVGDHLPKPPGKPWNEAEDGPVPFQSEEAIVRYEAPQ